MFAHPQRFLGRNTAGRGNLRPYNTGETYKPDPEKTAFRPRNTYDLVWREEGDEIVMGDAKGNEFARFESLDDVTNPSLKTIPAYYEYEPQISEYVVTIKGEKRMFESQEAIKKDGMVVRAPFIPEHEFEHQPAADDFAFVIFPDDDNEEYDGPQIYEQGELRPLLPADQDSELDQGQKPRSKEANESRAEIVESDESKHDLDENTGSDKDENPLLG